MSVFDVANYILERSGEMSAMKLQKLVYYSQAWSLVWEERPLFEDPIEAWANGPVCPELYKAHRGKFVVTESFKSGNSDGLQTEDKETIDAVLQAYGEKPAQWLSKLTHREAPWIEARKGLGPGQRGSEQITHAAMAEYYQRLDAEI